MIFEGLSDQQVAEMCREDYSAARSSRREIEERKIQTYRLYRTFRQELVGGGKTQKANGPFGWSRLTDPIVFVMIETILPRIGIDPPRVIATADNPQAVIYQQAKQMRLNHQMKAANMREETILTLKQFLLFGDGPVKTPWDADLGGPRMLAIDWFDWFVSVDAARWHDAECLMHRTWHTARSLSALVKRDSKREGGPLYDHKAIERLAHGANGRESEDETYAARREATGLGSASWGDNDTPIALVEMHFKDGSMAVVAGDESPIAVRISREPMFLDPKGRPYRPFSVFQNTPDLFQPYGISDGEMVEDHQHESSTIKNQAIDQATGNLNAPKAFNRQKISADEVQAAWSQPNGVLPVDGDPREVVFQFPAGQLSNDVERVTEMIRRNAQEVVGVNDVVQGLAASSDQTATEVSTLREEANQRFRFKLALIDLGMNRVACNWDWMDRAISKMPVSVPLDADFQMEPDARGISVLAGGKFARVDTAANAAGNQYTIEIESGSMIPPAQADQANKTRALVADLSHPSIAPMVNWPELARVLVESHGQTPERVLLDPSQMAPPGMGAMMGMGADPGAPPAGEVPVGPPIPIGQNGPSQVAA